MPTILYVGGLTSAEKGAVGTHTAGVLGAFADLGVAVHGLFLDDQIPHAFRGSTTLVKSLKHASWLKKIIDRLQLIRQARRMRDEFDYVYTRFDPIISFLVVNSRTLVEYNDDFLGQIRFAAHAGQFTKIGTMLRMSSIYSAAIQAMERFCFRKARLVACVTEGLCDVVIRRAPDAQVTLMNNGSSATYDHNLDPGYDDRVLRLGHVGTLTYWDGLSELFHALAKYVNDYPDQRVHLLVLGEGPMKGELQKLRKDLGLESIVEMKPPVTHNIALQVLHRIDVVPLLKTIGSYGLSPIKYYEALCTGRVILSSDIKHINEIRPDEGMVVSFPLDITEVADAIRALHLRLSDIRASVAQRSSIAVATYSWISRVRELMHTLADLTDVEPRARSDMEPSHRHMRNK